jgi:peptide/nickel transport system substrate-binding protein
LKKPFCASNWSVRPTAEFMLSMLLQSGAPWNETGWKNETFDKLLAASRIERDEAKRKQLYHEMQLLIVNEGGELIPFFRDSVCALSNKLRGYVPIPGNGILSGNRYAEKAWFDG